MRTPEVRIYFSWHLYDTVSMPLDRVFGGADDRIATKETAEEYAANYRREWAKREAEILPALARALGVEFYRNVIDVPCAPWMHSISDPLTMGFRYFPDQFVDCLTHELCHVLLTDNTVYSMHSSAAEIRLNERWARLFGKRDFIELVHIPVHALCKYIWLDVLHEPSRLERDIADVKGNPPYAAAWGYVQAHDYREIAAQLRTDYQDLKKELARK